MYSDSLVVRDRSVEINKSDRLMSKSLNSGRSTLLVHRPINSILLFNYTYSDTWVLLSRGGVLKLVDLESSTIENTTTFRGPT